MGQHYKDELYIVTNIAFFSIYKICSHINAVSCLDESYSSFLLAAHNIGIDQICNVKG